MSVECNISTYGGVPTVFINGIPKLLMGYKSGALDSGMFEDFVAAGFHTAHCNIKLENIWVDEGLLDWHSMDQTLEAILQVDPNSHIIVELHANAPQWWLEIHPDQQQKDISGLRYGQSMASGLWLEDSKEVVSECVREVEKHYGDNAVLYLVGAGHTWEWFHRTPLRYVIDCSVPMRDAFASWQAKKYNSDHLRVWSKDVRMEDIVIPTWQEIVASDLGSIRDPKVRSDAIDFLSFYNECMADLIIDFGKVVKQACEGKKLYGAFYGHLLDWLDNPLTAQHSGHFSLEKILSSDVVDVIAGPNSYMKRDVGNEASFTSATASIQLHNKLWLAETDTRTYLAESNQDFCGRPGTLEDSLSVLKRDFAHVLLSGVDMVWFSLFKGWFDDPAIMRFMAQARNIANIAMKTDRRSVANIAVLIDEKSVFATSGRDAYRVDPFISQEPRSSDMFPHIGCPFDIYLTSDIERMDVDRYKSVFFLNPISLDENLRQLIETKLKRDGRVLVWFGIPGLVRDKVLVDNIADLIGMKVGLEKEPSEVFIRMNWNSHPISKFANFGNILPTWVDGDFASHFGTNQILSPRVYVEDDRATPLGVYSRDGRVGFAVREFENWNSVFIGAPFSPPAILRQIALWSGTHIYNQSENCSPDNSQEYEKAGWNPVDVINYADDILYANDNFLSLHVKYPGPRHLVLPEQRQVFDVFENRIVVKKSDHFELDCSSNTTYLFYIGQIPWKEIS